MVGGPQMASVMPKDSGDERVIILRHFPPVFMLPRYTDRMMVPVVYRKQQ